MSLLRQLAPFRKELERRGKKATHLEAHPGWLDTLLSELPTIEISVHSQQRNLLVAGLELVPNHLKVVPEVQVRVDGRIVDYEMVGDSKA